MLKLIALLLLLNVYFVSSSDIVFDVCFGTAPPTTSSYSCMKQYQPEIILWLYNDQKGINSYSVQSFTNARNGGLKLQIGFSPCRPISPQQVVADFMTKTGGYIEAVWVFPFNFFEGCSWAGYSTPLENCQYLQQVILQFKARQVKVGVSSSSFVWQLVMGALDACPELKEQRFAWVPTEKEQDNQPDFNNYVEIGGWEKPYMKLYSNNVAQCGRNLNVLYYE